MIGPRSEDRIGLPTQAHGDSGHFAQGPVAGKTGKTPDAPLVEAVPPGQHLPDWLTGSQRQAVLAWLSQFQPQINEAASGGDIGQWGPIIAGLDEAIAAAPPTGGAQVVHRDFAATGLTAGSIVQASGFVAASPTAVSADSATIMVPIGSHALALPGELLLPRGTQFRVDGVTPLQMTVISTSSQQPAPTRQLNHYRLLWMRAETAQERAEILAAVRRIPGGLRP